MLGERQRAWVDGRYDCGHGKAVALSQNVVNEDFERPRTSHPR
jgi:hypothetical protein